MQRRAIIIAIPILSVLLCIIAGILKLRSLPPEDAVRRAVLSDTSPPCSEFALGLNIIDTLPYEDGAVVLYTRLCMNMRGEQFVVYGSVEVHRTLTGWQVDRCCNTSLVISPSPSVDSPLRFQVSGGHGYALVYGWIYSKAEIAAVEASFDNQQTLRQAVDANANFSFLQRTRSMCARYVSTIMRIM